MPGGGGGGGGGRWRRGAAAGAPCNSVWARRTHRTRGRRVHGVTPALPGCGGRWPRADGGGAGGGGQRASPRRRHARPIVACCTQPAVLRLGWASHRREERCVATRGSEWVGRAGRSSGGGGMTALRQSAIAPMGAPACWDRRGAATPLAGSRHGAPLPESVSRCSVRGLEEDKGFLKSGLGWAEMTGPRAGLL